MQGKLLDTQMPDYLVPICTGMVHIYCTTTTAFWNPGSDSLLTCRADTELQCLVEQQAVRPTKLVPPLCLIQMYTQNWQPQFDKYHFYGLLWRNTGLQAQQKLHNLQQICCTKSACMHSLRLLQVVPRHQSGRRGS